MEYWDLYNIDGSLVNLKIKRGDSIPDNMYHRVIHVWIMNERKEYLIQKRALHLNWFPGKWATTTGSVQSGHLDIINESYRELSEELGLDETKIDLEYIQDIIVGKSIVSILKGFIPYYMIQNLKLNDEVTEVKWVKKSKLNQLRDENEFATYSEELFDIILKFKFQ